MSSIADNFVIHNYLALESIAGRPDLAPVVSVIDSSCTEKVFTPVRIVEIGNVYPLASGWGMVSGIGP